MTGVSSFAASGVFAYLIAATLAEVFLFYTLSGVGVGLVYASIGLIAATKAVLIIAFFMELRYEPRPIRMITLLAAMFLALTIIVMIFSFPHP